MKLVIYDKLLALYSYIPLHIRVRSPSFRLTCLTWVVGTVCSQNRIEQAPVESALWYDLTYQTNHDAFIR